MDNDDRKWCTLSTAYPPEGVPVDCITENGKQVILIYYHNLWWVDDMSMYVYFTPTMWRPRQSLAGTMGGKEAK